MNTSNLPDFFRRVNRSRLGWESYPEMSSLQRQMDRAFSDAWGNTDVAPIGLREPAFAPACDVEETENHYLMTFDLPGVKKEDIKIDLLGHMLTVRGERREEHEKKDKNRYRSERFYGSFERSFQLPAEMKADQIDAQYSEGVLTLHVPKTESMKAQQIKIGERNKSSSVKVA